MRIYCGNPLKISLFMINPWCLKFKTKNGGGFLRPSPVVRIKSSDSSNSHKKKREVIRTSRSYQEITSFYAKMSTTFLCAQFLPIIPENYHNLSKSVYIFFVDYIFPQYIWNIAHFWEKCKHQRCHYNFLPIISEKLPYFLCIVMC